MKGILDRFEDNNKAVILLEEIKEELIVPIEKLPVGSNVNTYFNIEKLHEEYKIISIDEGATQQEARKTSDLMARMRAKSNGSKYRKK